MTTRKKAKILYIITKSNWGGSQRYLYDLVTHIDPETFEPVVAYGGSGKKNAKPGRLAELLIGHPAIKTISVNHFMRDINIFKELGSFFELFSIIRSEKPDIVHLNSSKAGGIGAAAARLLLVRKIVFTVHGFAHNEPRSGPTRALVWFFSWITLLLCTDIICITRQDYNDATRMPGVSKKLHLIHNGIPKTAVASKADAQKIFANHRESLKDHLSDIPWIGTGTELTRNKGIGYLIAACKQLRDAGQIFVLVIVGTGELQQELQDQAETAGISDAVVFTDFFPNLEYHLAAFDVFVLASSKEGLPYSLLETAHAGVPTIATDVGGIPEIITSETGVLVPKENPDALYQGLTRVLADNAPDFGLAHKKRIEQYFSLEQMLKKTATVYKS